MDYVNGLRQWTVSMDYVNKKVWNISGRYGIVQEHVIRNELRQSVNDKICPRHGPRQLYIMHEMIIIIKLTR